MANLNAAAAAASHLRRLFVLRNVAIAGQALAVWFADSGLGLALPAPIWSAIAALAGVNLLTWLRLRQPWPVADLEIFCQLVADVLALAAVLYFSGGSTNPFVSLFLVPLTIAATTLPSRFTWAMVGATLLCYTVLLFYYVPLPDLAIGSFCVGALCAPQDMLHDHDGHDSGFGLHVWGMWFNFLVSAGLIAFFVVRMARSIRERDRLLAAAREETLRNERIVALGTLAAGAAHELGTPLSTMAVITRELQEEGGNDAERSENLRLLRDQVDHCKGILTRLLASAGQPRAEGGARLPLPSYLAEVMDQWRLMRPGIVIRTRWEGSRPDPEIVSERTLTQALLNLLNNAADASPRSVEVRGRWTERELTLEILDRGPGLTPEAARNAGQPFFTTKEPGHGIGIGLFLANATIERLGGTVRLMNREGGGAMTRVTLPLACLGCA